ncbi:uncharacterized protein EDB93DRAFT_1225938, partial [Suillus bovinus]|uniref:uncharacterized protein n=1 Tax=Suillus bovinus TaxID=48563 RepID=UPI001B86D758
MLPCGRVGCPVVFVYGVGTVWPTVSCVINGHSPACRGGFYGLNHAPPRSNTYEAQQEELENDKYIEDVQPTSVRCCRCQKAISLDKRSKYYPGLWLKHRGKVPRHPQDRGELISQEKRLVS